jgi:hypothetical protein
MLPKYSPLGFSADKKTYPFYYSKNPPNRKVFSAKKELLPKQQLKKLLFFICHPPWPAWYQLQQPYR